jgi:tRNA1Val (adenine37-N6)-methyltransferase
VEVIDMSKKDQEFRFKQFSIQHDQSSMKVGTDAVLLGAWVNVSNAQRILEIGSGSGVIALMLAQRSLSDTQIDAIDIDESSVRQARENVAHSSWKEKVQVHHIPLQEWQPGVTYDLIVSNPPFFNNSLLPPNAIRRDARHSVTLTCDQLLACAKNLLAPGGKLAVVLPYQEGTEWMEKASRIGMFVNRRLAFFTRAGKPQERWLLEWGLFATEMEDSTLVLYEVGNQRTADYRNLTSSFYLD